ncbi:hypothetical protein [Sulfurimonas sp. HSL3-7]|uniref:hypothetical protein n=1 Tax=Sulfonitrofixus jiaomeiensis TaxID=3131938 RepID=UPI0031F8E942
MKKELLIYLLTVVVSALIMHPDLLSTPLIRFDTMANRANYYHPFLFGLGVYLMIGIVRLIVVGLKKIMKR